MKRFYYFLSILLSFAILVGMLPAIPAGETLPPDVEATDAVLQSDEKVPAIVLGEVTDLRDKYTKHFRMSDGTMVAATYPEAVHFLQNGKWTDVDNSLVDSVDATGQAVLKNSNNSYKIDFAKQSDTENLVNLSFDGFSISWGVEQGSSVAVKENVLITSDETVPVADTTAQPDTASTEEAVVQSKTDSTAISAMSVRNTKNAVTYTEILTGIDLEYILRSEELKENIILKNSNTQNSISFHYDFGGLLPVLNTDGSISLCSPDTGENTGILLAAPYMTDAQGMYSSDIKVAIELTGNTHLITLTADRTWLDAEDRIYPVTIDPTLRSTVDVPDIRDTYITDEEPNSILNMLGYTKIANQNSSGHEYIEYIKFRVLPSLKSSDQVVDAQLLLYPYHIMVPETAYSLYYANTPKPYINAYKVTGSWESETLTYNTTPRPATESIVLDYEIVDGSADYADTRAYEWDITRAVKGWYEDIDTNQGIKLQMSAEIPTSTWVAYFLSSDYPYLLDVLKPTLLVTYRNTSGLEGCYTYHEQGTGRAGTGYVNDYTGNLVFVHNDASTSGNLFPTSVNHMYGNDKRIESINYGSTFPKYGQGWSVDAIRKIVACSDELTAMGYPYKYVDGDGTDHYFFHDLSDPSGIYVDEDGLGLKLQVYTSLQENLYWFKITDKAGNAMQFDKQMGTGGVLRKAVDTNGKTNQYTYAYVSYGAGYYYRLSTVTDGAGRIITFGYDTSHRLSTITDPAGRVTTYTYSGENLASINYEDGKQSQYVYAGSSGFLSKATNNDGYSIEYTYSSASNPPIHITDIKESNGTSYGGLLGVAYAHNTTVFTDNRNNRTQTYQFNNWGNTVGVIDGAGSGSNYTYNNASDISHPETFMKNNSLASAADVNKSVVNLLSNPSFESGLTSWTAGGYGSVSVSATDPLIGNSILVTSNANPADNAYSAAYSTGMTTLGAGTYTVSAYVRTTTIENDGFTGVFGAGIDLKITNNGVTRYVVSDLYKGTTDVAIDGGWRRVALTFTLVAGDVLDCVFVGLFNSTGTAYIDGVQMEKGASMNQYNLVENSSFERNSGLYSTPPMWTGVGALATDETSITNAVDGSYSYKLTGDPATSTRLCQTIQTNGSEGDVYSLSAWVTANSAYPKNDYSFCMFIRTDYSDGSIGFKTFDFNNAVSTKQMVAGTFVVDDGNPTTTKDYDRLYVFFGYYNNVNAAYVDNIQLYRDSQQSYQLDDSGNLVSTADKAQQSSTFTYTNNSLAKMANPDGSSYEYVYDTSKRVTLARSSEGAKYSFIYDSNGNPTSSEIRSDAYSASIIPGTAYYIRSKYSAKYLKVYNGGTTAGTLVKQLTMDRSTAQQWQVVSAGGGYYRFVPQNATGMSMDVTNGSPANSTQIQINTTADVDKQKFKLIPNADGTYQILTRVSEDLSGLDVYNASRDENAQILQYSYSGITNQRWIFEPVSKITSSTNWDAPATDAVFCIRSRLSGKYIDVYNAGTADGTRAIQYGFSGNNNQLFKLISYSSGYYKLQPLHVTGKVLALGGTNGYGETQIILETIKTSDDNDQYFKFVKNGTNSSYNIVSKTDDVSTFDISQGSYNDSMDLIFTGGTTQARKEFILEKVSDKIRSSATYTTDGNYPASVTDARGNTSYFGYDTTIGTLSSVRAPGETTSNQTDYTYDPDTDALKTVTKKMNDSQTVTNSYDYVNDKLDKISHNGFDYRFTYDIWGNPTTVKVGVGTNLQTLVTNAYKPYNGLLDTVTYGNGDEISYVYDDPDYDYLTSVKYNGVEKFKYTYNNSGNLHLKEDLINTQTVNYLYDFIDRLTQVKNSNGLDLNFNYDSKNRLSNYTSTLNGVSFKTGYIYGDPTVSSSQKAGLIYGIKQNDTTQIISYGYDTLARRSYKSINQAIFSSSYSYLPGAAGNTTALLDSITNYGMGHPSQKISYTYDMKGNISTISENGILKVSYFYDNLNQLVRENSVYQNGTITYSFNSGGNITAKKYYSYTTQSDLSGLNPIVTIPYGYTDSLWKDKLTSYSYTPVNYDEIGNISSIGSKQFGWDNGRQLMSIQNVTQNVSFKYDDSGIRTQKTVGAVTTDYFLSGTSVEAETNGTDTLRYFYDENGDLIGFNLTNATYPTGSNFYYVRNGQNDIIGILATGGSLVVSYLYDSWGRLISTTGTLATTIGVINPYRYRGYRYDVETGLYYVTSRYYDPNIGRFLNADVMVSSGASLLGTNMFAYCYGNPVNLSDPSGYLASYNTMMSDSGSNRFTLEQRLQAYEVRLGINLSNIQNTIAASLGAVMKKLKDSKLLKKDDFGHFNEVYAYPKAIKYISYIGYTVDVALLSWDINKIWSNDTYSTNTKVAGTAIAFGGCAAGFAVGYLSLALVNAWNPVGWSMGMVAGVFAVGILTYGALTGIATTQNYLYKRVGIY
ncbi:MAG: RICIN domain-containing protein [Saccharofermentanales bacterium]